MPMISHITTASTKALFIAMIAAQDYFFIVNLPATFGFMRTTSCGEMKLSFCFRCSLSFSFLPLCLTYITTLMVTPIVYYHHGADVCLLVS